MSLFRTGQTVCTGSIDVMMRSDPCFASWVASCLERHCTGDWGDISEDDREMNDEAVRMMAEGRSMDSVMSSYTMDGIEIWIITECDNSVTTILRPEEY